jgi:hypothetical protein
MLSKIDNLDELLAEKKRLQAQIQIVEQELQRSTQQTREIFKEILDTKLSIPNQLVQLFQGEGKGVLKGSAIGALGRVAGLGSWWSGVLSAVLPMLFNFVRDQIQRRKEDHSEPEPQQEPKPKTKRRNPFKRKPKAPKDPAPDA